MVSELVNDFTALPPDIQAWALTRVGAWATAAAEKLGVAAWQKGKTTLLGDALHRAFQAGLTEFMDGFPAHDDADYDVLRQPFEDDTISEESAKLLRLGDDPVDLDRIETSLRAAGLEPETLPDFDLGQALQRFFLAFLNAANDEEELRDKFQTALQYRTAQDSPIRFKHDHAAVARYNQHVVDRYGRLTLYSLKADAPLRVELERVYVQLTAVERVRRREPRLEWANGPGEEELVLDPVLSRRVIAHLEKRSEDEEDAERQADARIEREITVERKLSAREALAEALRLVVVGAPGSGKTTLLQWIALTFARDAAQERMGLAEQRVPVFVPLRALGKHIGSHPDRFEPTPACLLDFLAGHFGAWQLDLPAEFFVRLAGEGRCAFLFDGLDEVADPGRRADVARAVQAFVARYPGNRYAVTSRPAGYTGLARFGADFQRCDVRPFSDDDVRDFVTNWYLAVETAGEDNPATRLKADENAADLLQRIRENDRIRRLVDTPLLLTVVALVHQNRTTLPHRRAELYDECTQMLLGFWDEQKGGEAARELAQLGELDRYEKRAILEPIALRLHEQREAREVEGPDLRRWLTEEFAAVGDPDPDKRAKLFLQVIQERAGLLVESDADTYRFSHLTFQEYLAARAVADRDDYVAYTLARRQDAWWREVILLEAGHLSTPRSKRARRLTTALVEAIWQAEDEDPLEQEIERLLRRNLLLAGRCLADLGPIGIDETERDTIVTELGETLRTTPYSKLREEAARVLAGLGGGGSTARAAAELIPALSAEEWSVRQAAASSLGQLGQASPDVVTALIAALSAEEWSVRQAAASSLGQLGQISPDVVTALIAALSDDNWPARQAAASGLGQLRQTTLDVATALIAALADDDWPVREAAASSLGQLATADFGRASPDVVQTLISALADDNWPARQAAASSLVRLGQTGPDVVQALTTTLADDDWSVREAAASSLVQLGQVSPDVVQTLISALADDDRRVRQAAVSSLGQLGQATPDIVTALIAALADDNSDVRQAVVSSLGQLATADPGRASPDVVTALISALSDDDWHVRQAAASGLGQLATADFGRTGPDVVQTLISALADDELSVRRAAASSLGRLATADLGRTGPDVVQALISALAADDPGDRQAAASSLVQLGQASPDVVQALISALADAELPFRYTAASSLGQLGQASSDVVQALIAALADVSPYVRQSAAASLGQLGGDDEEAVIKALLPVFTDPAVKKTILLSIRPAYDYAYDALWAIAGPGIQEAQETE